MELKVPKGLNFGKKTEIESQGSVESILGLPHLLGEHQERAGLEGLPRVLQGVEHIQEFLGSGSLEAGEK